MSKTGRMRWGYALFAALMILPGLLPQITAASSTYGEDGYSDCKYQANCPKSNQDNSGRPPVPVTPAPVTPSPQIVVVSNIADNQTIDSKTTEIVITHLERINPDGTRTVIPTNEIGWVAFYVDDKLVTTQYNTDKDGRFHISWDVEKFPGTRIALVFYDRLGNIIQRLDKKVKLAAALAGGPLASGFKPSSHKKVILTPQEEAVLKTLPYWLLLILLAIALRLWIQSVREIRATARLRSIIQNEREIYQQKQNFVSLIAHYLRTPLTALRGGIELLGLPPDKPDTIALDKAYGALSSKIENVLNTIDAKVTDITVSADAATLTKRPAITMPFWMLIGSFLLVTALLEAMATYFTTISYSWFDLLAELLTGIAVIVFLLLGVRQSQMKQIERKHQEHNLTAQTALDASRNHFIDKAAQDLRSALDTLSKACQPLAQQPTAGKFITHGINDLAQVIIRLNIAATINASRTASSTEGSSLILNDIIAKALRDNWEQVTAKHLSIDAPHTKFSLLSNPALVTFVIESLVENAVKFTDDYNSITITITQDADTIITIHDTGPGIPESKLDKLFEPFSRAADATDFSHEGMGFDLYLCKIIMQRIGGTIELTSQPKAGTTATITFPNLNSSISNTRR